MITITDLIEKIDYELGYLVGEPRYYSSEADTKGRYDVDEIVKKVREYMYNYLSQIDKGK